MSASWGSPRARVEGATPAVGASPAPARRDTPGRRVRSVSSAWLLPSRALQYGAGSLSVLLLPRQAAGAARLPRRANRTPVGALHALHALIGTYRLVRCSGSRGNFC